MIVETLFAWACDMIYQLFSTFEFINLPVDLLQTLLAILEFGTWVVGADVLALFTSSLLFWAAFNMSAGLIVWIWKMLPLT